jgi:Fe-S oxidoreductase
LLRGELDAGDGGDEAVREALDLCLQCKACRRECPTGVDMARLKVEFLAGLHERHGASLADRLYGRFRQGIALAARMPALANRLGRSATVRAVLERVAGVDRRRSLPELPAAAFRAMAPESTLAAEAAPPATVVLFDDEFVGPLEPAIPLAALAVLDAAGERVALPPRPVSSARSLISRGMLAAAREELLELLEALEAPLAAGLPVVGLEPSALLTFRDELLALLPDDARAARLASACQLFDEFMLDRMHRIAWRQEPVRIVVHAHCHRQAIAGTDALGRLLEALPGVEATILDAGCCGMAGSFGYDRRHYDLSMAVGERVLFPAVRGAGPKTLLLIEGMSCRHQVLDGTGRRGLHTAEVLARRLPVAPGSE